MIHLSNRETLRTERPEERTVWESVYLNTTVGGFIIIVVACIAVLTGYTIQYLQNRGEQQNPGGRWWL